MDRPKAEMKHVVKTAPDGAFSTHPSFWSDRPALLHDDPWRRSLLVRSVAPGFRSGHWPMKNSMPGRSSASAYLREASVV